MQIVELDEDMDKNNIMDTMKQLGHQLDNMQNKFDQVEQSSFESLTEVKDIEHIEDIENALDDKYMIETQ